MGAHIMLQGDARPVFNVCSILDGSQEFLKKEFTPGPFPEIAYLAPGPLLFLISQWRACAFKKLLKRLRVLCFIAVIQDYLLHKGTHLFHLFPDAIPDFLRSHRDRRAAKIIDRYRAAKKCSADTARQEDEWAKSVTASLACMNACHKHASRAALSMHRAPNRARYGSGGAAPERAAPRSDALHAGAECGRGEIDQMMAMLTEVLEQTGDKG
jgi:hypothetical protein